MDWETGLDAPKRRSEIAKAWRAHLTPDHGLPETECETYCSMSGDVTHLAIGVDKDGRGPVFEHEPGYTETVCWCQRPGCTLYRRD